ncbi:MAG: glycosyltransferase [Proteobacteria bacterium]|nr:glycosyltransferase [Pseudomonadota bacterium]
MNNDLKREQRSGMTFETEASPPDVSIVMPAYNAARDIRESIASVLSQTYSSFELIVVDDASSDGTVEIVKALSTEDARVRLLENPVNQGVSFSRNRGMNNARGRYLMFLDSDDAWHDDKVERQVSFMRETANVVTYMDYLRFDDAEPADAWPVHAPDRIAFRDLLVSNEIGMLTAAVDRWKVPKLPAFRKQGHEDYLFWLDLLRGMATQQAVKVPTSSPAARYRQRHGSVSSNYLKAALWHWNVLGRQKLPLHVRILLMFRYLARAVGKRSRLLRQQSASLAS